MPVFWEKPSTERSLEELRRLKEADTDAEKAAILEELEQVADAGCRFSIP